MSETPHTPNSASLLQKMSPDDVKTLIQEKIALAYHDIKDSESVKSRLKMLTGKILDLDKDMPETRIHVNYIIDPYDIIEFCFPFGFDMLRSDFQGADMDIKADRMNTWDNFFLSSPKVLLMDQHKDELGRLRNRLLKDMNQNISEFTEFEKKAQEIFNYQPGVELSEDEIKNIREEILDKRLKWLLAAGTGELYNGPARFKKVLDKLVIHDHQLDISLVAPWIENINEKDAHINTIQDIFFSTPASDEAYVDGRKMISQMKSKGFNVDARRENNIMVDHMVVNRLLNINLKFQEREKDLGCRYVFLYLSSDDKSDRISNQLEKRSPTFFEHPFSLMRNVGQLYINTLFSDALYDNSRSALMDTELFIDIVKNLVFAYDALLKRQTQADSEIDKLFAIRRARIEWSGQMNLIMSYPDKLENIFVEFEKKALFEPLRLALLDLISVLQQNEAKDSLKQFVKEIRDFNVYVTVFQKITFILHRNPTPDIASKGSVVGINHHLPTLFKRVYPTSNYEHLLEKTIQIILSPTEVPDFSADLKRVLNEIKDVLLVDKLSDISSSLLRESIEEELEHYKRECLLHLLALILPSDNIKKYINTKNSYYENPKNELDYLLNFDIDSLGKKINKRKDDQTDRERLRVLYSNLQYIKIWSLRRSKELDDCDTLLTSFLDDKHFKDDIRFIHGRALLSYSRLISKFEDERIDLMHLSKADRGLQIFFKKTELDVKNALSAFENYTGDEFNSSFFDKAHSAILNTFIYIEVLLYGMLQNVSKLKNARNFLDNKMVDFETERRSHPEYLHTEATLEYFEGVQALKENNTALAANKFRFAKKAIVECIDIYSKLFPKNNVDPDYLFLQIEIDKKIAD